MRPPASCSFHHAELPRLRPAGAAPRRGGFGARSWLALRRSSLRSVTVHVVVVSRYSPAKTRPCALSGPGPLSQCAPSGAPSRVCPSRPFGRPATAGDRNSRYMTLKNGSSRQAGGEDSGALALGQRGEFALQLVRVTGMALLQLPDLRRREQQAWRKPSSGSST